MMFASDSHETIAALATPAGEGGVAVIRISGPQAPQLLSQLFQIKSSIPHSFKEKSKQSWQSHHLYYGVLKTPEGEWIDECLAVWMKAPHSFTGEEVVEFHIHGGRLLVQRLLETLFCLGARPARPGEFTQRAFLNGKIDLTQAEAVADLIAAKSQRALKLAQAQWQGELSTPVAALRKTLLEILVNLEAAVDFPEEEVEIIDRQATETLFHRAISRLEQWLQDYELGRLLRDGITVVLLGKPNVGKSSLLNQLIREEAAIVHDEPGTTRDAIERSFQLGGLSLRLIDTAGIRDQAGVIEQKGIERSKQWLEKADLVLVLLDQSRLLDAEDKAIFSLLQHKRCLLLLNKSDLAPVWDAVQLSGVLEAVSGSRFPALSISAKTGENLEQLEQKILELLGIDALEKGEHLLINQLRHQKSLQQAREALFNARRALLEKFSPEFIAADLQQAIRHLGEMIGEVDVEEVLGEIFSRFCIGK